MILKIEQRKKMRALDIFPGDLIKAEFKELDYAHNFFSRFCQDIQTVDTDLMQFRNPTGESHRPWDNYSVVDEFMGIAREGLIPLDDRCLLTLWGHKESLPDSFRKPLREGPMKIRFLGQLFEGQGSLLAPNLGFDVTEGWQCKLDTLIFTHHMRTAVYPLAAL